MKSPREYLRKKYPEYESERGLTGHDDEHMERLMLEYAEYYAAQHSVQQMGLLARLSKWFGVIAHR